MASTGAADKLRSTYVGTGSFDTVLDLRIFIKDCGDESGRKRPLMVKPWSTVKDVKDQIFHAMAIPPSAQRLFISGPLQNYGVELPNHWTLNDAGVYKSGATLSLEVRNGYGSYDTSGMSAGAKEDAKISSPQSRRLSENLNARPYDIRVAPSMKSMTPKIILQSIQKSLRGFLRGFKPELVLEGSGGTYFLHDARKIRIGVFKPSDEEPYAENNPRGYVNTNPCFNYSEDGPKCSDDDSSIALRAGVKPGESCLREVAAFVLDHGGFCSVPITTLVVARHPAFHNSGTRLKVYEGGAGFGSHSISSGLLNSPTPSYGLVMESSMNSLDLSHISNGNSSEHHCRSKIGSFQEFVRSECTMDDLSPSLISVDEVHKIALLDIRLLNADRNVGNLLVRRRQDNSLTLVPIDHGYCLRSVCDIASFDWCWLEWKQTKEPVSKATHDYIMSLDVEEDIKILKDDFHFGQKALDYFRASTMMLQAGIAAGLTLYDIAYMVCRHDFDGELPSTMETLINQATDFAYSAIENGRWHHSAASRALADKLSSLPMNTSLVFPPTDRMIRSTSSSDFLHSDYGAHATTGNRKGSPPPSANTSYSEDSGGSSVGSCEGEENDCADWAAAYLADVSMEVNNLEFARGRAESLASNGTEENSASSMSSAPGFWTCRPGKADQTEDLDHFESSSSSNSFSPDSLSGPSFDIDEDGDFDSSERLQNFDTLSPIEPLGSPTFAPMETQVQPELKKAVIKRSQSYSAFTLIGNGTPSLTALPSKRGQRRSFNEADNKQHRDYFLKFIGLLIEREIHVASKSKMSPSRK